MCREQEMRAEGRGMDRRLCAPRPLSALFIPPEEEFVWTADSVWERTVVVPTGTTSTYTVTVDVSVTVT